MEKNTKFLKKKFLRNVNYCVIIVNNYFTFTFINISLLSTDSPY